MILSNIPIRFLRHHDHVYAENHGWGRLVDFGIRDESKRVDIHWNSGEIFHNVLLADMTFVEHRGRDIRMSIDQLNALEKCRTEIERFVADEHESKQWGGPTIPPKPIDIGVFKAILPALKAIK